MNLAPALLPSSDYMTQLLAGCDLVFDVATFTDTAGVINQQFKTSNPKRIAMAIFNNSAADIWISPFPWPNLNNGWKIPAGGTTGILTFREWLIAPTMAWFAGTNAVGTYTIGHWRWVTQLT